MSARVLLVTGGSRGIGAAVATAAAREGYAVAVAYRAGRDAAEAVVQRIRGDGGNAAAIQADVSEERDVVRLFQAVDAEFGALQALVNSAGIEGNLGRVSDFDAAILQRLLAVNVTGTMLCCREAVRRMSTRLGGGGGAIVNISSMAATIGGRAGASDYAASKAAVDTFTVGLAKEVGEEGIRVNAVRPGMTLTDMTDRLRRDPARLAEVAATIAQNRVAEADEIAAPVLWLLTPAAAFVSGACLDVSGGGFIVGPRLAETD